MTTPCKWILLPAILITILTVETGRETHAAEGIFDREPFRVNEGLSPDFRDADGKKMAPLWEDFSTEGIHRAAEGMNPREAAASSADGDRQRGLHGVRFGYFHLFLSRTVSEDGKGRDVIRSEYERNSLLTTVQSLPGVLRSDPVVAIDSVRRIFAPQVNLGIEF
ncbi:MAG: hypothetical protein KJ649_10760 [Proteobacteria bacterium]|nr:hypothetical protein [Pseudomonadota bacterium]MBU1745360.1 hypothetical protein [Pseudomonadota bacterium]MBU1965966.1 hypothetical protein [Pseudomonadota bacterium]